MEHKIISDDSTIQCFYERLVEKGTHPNLAEMFAFQQAPVCRTDVEFLRGRMGKQFSESPMQEYIGNKYKEVAESKGQNVKGKIYMPGLAKYPGDPEAWVSDRGDVKRVLEKNNWTVRDGAVTNTPDGRTEEAPPV